MYSASQLPCASTSSAGSPNHAVCEVNVGEDRVWAVQVLPRRRLVGGNSRRVICYSYEQRVSPVGGECGRRGYVFGVGSHDEYGHCRYFETYGVVFHDSIIDGIAFSA